MPTELGEGEGQVNLIAWAGYVEDGSTDPGRRLGHPVRGRRPAARSTSSSATSSDEMVQLMQTGEYDGVSASGDATHPPDRRRRGRAGQHRPDPELRRRLRGPEAPAVELGRRRAVRRAPRPRRQPARVQHRGLPDGSRLVGARCSRPTSAAAGAVSVYDTPIYIADAAVYLMATQPDLGITNPYALDQTQFDAAIALLEQQKDLAGQYWAVYTDQQAELEGGTVLAGTTWQVIVNLAQGERRQDRRRQAGRRRHRMVRHVDDLVEGGSTRTACTCGWTRSSRRRPTPASPSGSVRHRPTRRAAT